MAIKALYTIMLSPCRRRCKAGRPITAGSAHAAALSLIGEQVIEPLTLILKIRVAIINIAMRFKADAMRRLRQLFIRHAIHIGEAPYHRQDAIRRSISLSSPAPLMTGAVAAMLE